MMPASPLTVAAFLALLPSSAPPTTNTLIDAMPVWERVDATG